MPETPGAQVNVTAARPQQVGRLLLALFLLQLVVCVLHTTGLLPGGRGGFTDALLVLFAAAVTFAWLLSRLPLQNVLAALGFMALLFAAAQSIRGIVALQPSAFAHNIGPQLVGTVPLLLLPVWLVALCNCRGTAKLLLLPWRNGSRYGFLMIGLSAALFTVFELALEAYAAGLKSYWTWDKTLATPHPFVAPASNYLFWLAVALCIQVVVAPWLIDKRPVQRRPELSPLLLWTSLLLFLGVGAAAASLWGIAVLTWAFGAAVAVLALAGWRRSS